MGVLDQQEDPTRRHLDPPNKGEGSDADQEAWGDPGPEPLASAGVDKEAGKPIAEHRVQVGGRAYPACVGVGVGEARNRSSGAVEEDTRYWPQAEDNDPEHLDYAEGGRSCLVGDIEVGVGADVGEGEGNGKVGVLEACTSFRVSD
jgi:hypothetical protein